MGLVLKGGVYKTIIENDIILIICKDSKERINTRNMQAL